MVIAATFLTAAAADGLAQMVVGGATDRCGRARPIRIALSGTVAFLVIVAVPDVLWFLLVVVVLGCAVLGALNTPAMTLLSDGAEDGGACPRRRYGAREPRLGRRPGRRCNGGRRAAATSDAAVYLLLAAMCALTLVWALCGGSWAVVPAAAT